MLRITTETVPQRIKDISIDDAEDEDQIAAELETKQNDRLEWQRSLISYVSSYVKRYSSRLKDLAFWDELEPQTIYQNHSILCYVILEFHEKSELFDYTLLRNMCQQLWEPFFDTCD